MIRKISYFSLAKYVLYGVNTRKSDIAFLSLFHDRRERLSLPVGYPNTTYQYSRESTDSQPNSTGAIGLSMGSTDEVINSSQDFASSVLLPSSSSSSVVAVNHDLSHQRAVAAAAIQQTHLMNSIFNAPNVNNHRPFVYTNSDNPLPIQPIPYDMDYNALRSTNNHTQNESLYGTGTDHLRGGIGLGYQSEVAGNCATLSQQLTQAHNPSQSNQSPPPPPPTMDNNHTSETSIKLSPLSSTAATSGLRNSNSRGSAQTLSVAPSVLSPLSSTLGHVFTNPSAFYSPHYFNGVRNDSKSLLESFPRHHLPNLTNSQVSGGVEVGGGGAGGGGLHPGLCFYQTPSLAGATTLTDSLLIPEEVLSTYLDREKGYGDAGQAGGEIAHARQHHPVSLCEFGISRAVCVFLCVLDSKLFPSCKIINNSTEG